MKFLGWELTRTKDAPFESVLARLVASQEGYYGDWWTTGGLGWVTPENCMSSPTVHAIVTAVARRISVSPVEVFRQVVVETDTDEPGEPSIQRTRREILPNHPVATLLNYPNQWQDRTTYWLDATSRLIRYGNYYAYKSRGQTGPIRSLIPLDPRSVTVRQDLDTWRVTYTFNGRDVPNDRVNHARSSGRNCVTGDSPVIDVASSIGLEILAEQFGSTFFRNGALPLIFFKYAQGMQGFKTPEQERKFVEDYQNAVGGAKRHRAMLLPKGIETGDPIQVENDTNQFLETRKYQRTVIAGAFGVPPHMVGDLERATFNNVEQQSADFILNVVLPVARMFEASLERDLLTTADINGGVIIRFNLDAPQRVDFRSRQEGLKIQREAGVISANDWREAEGMNPIPDEDGGEDYIRPLNYGVAGEIPAGPALPPNAGDSSGSPPPSDGMKQLLLKLASTRSEVASAMEFVDRISRQPAPNITVNLPEQPAPIVHVRPEINVKPPEVHVEGPQIKIDAPTINVTPPAVTVPVQIEGAQVKVEAATSQPMDLIPVRGPDGRVTAIHHRPAKKAG